MLIPLSGEDPAKLSFNSIITIFVVKFYMQFWKKKWFMGLVLTALIVVIALIL